MRDLQSVEMGLWEYVSGKGGSLRRMFEKVALRCFPLNGVVPY
jgi:hypothetical protein